MSTIKADTVQAKDFASDLTLGASGDTVTVAADSINVDKVQDKGGNTLWDYSTGTFVAGNEVFGSQSLKLLQSQTFSQTYSVSFTSGIDSTYDVYFFKFININPYSDDVSFRFRVSINGGSSYGITKTTTVFNAYHSEDNSSAALGFSAGGRSSAVTTTQYLESLGNGSDECMAGEFYLFTPSSTTYVKHYYSTTTSYAESNGTYYTDTSGYFNTAAAIDAIQFVISDSNGFDGTIKMYGLL